MSIQSSVSVLIFYGVNRRMIATSMARLIFSSSLYNYNQLQKFKYQKCRLLFYLYGEQGWASGLNIARSTHIISSIDSISQRQIISLLAISYLSLSCLVVYSTIKDHYGKVSIDMQKHKVTPANRRHYDAIILTFMDREGEVDFVLERRYTVDGLAYMVKLVGQSCMEGVIMLATKVPYQKRREFEEKEGQFVKRVYAADSLKIPIKSKDTPAQHLKNGNLQMMSMREHQYNGYSIISQAYKRKNHYEHSFMSEKERILQRDRPSDYYY